jgi:hypothetical protein
MSIYGISGGRIGVPRERLESTGASAVAVGGGAGRTNVGVTAAPDQAARISGGLEPTSASLPGEAPAGTDPELWGVLTSEERAFYARTHALGPLTYGRGEARAPQESLARGIRLDLRV